MVREILESHPDEPPTGVICSNDLMAIGVLQEATELGLRVPDDLSVVGFDGIEATEWTQPALTTVEQPIDVIAKTAIAALGTQIEDPDQALASYVFRPRLKFGGTPPAESAALAAASAAARSALFADGSATKRRLANGRP